MAKNQLPFLEKINRKYGARAGSLFLIHGNINDIFAARNSEWKPLIPLLLEEFSKKNRIFVHVDLSGGLKILPVWPSCVEDLDTKEKRGPINLVELRKQHQKTQVDMLRGAVNALQENTWETLERESIQSSFAALMLARAVFEVVDKSSEGDRWRIIFVINDLSSIAPAQDEGHLSESDRRNIQFLHKWFNSSDFLNSRHVVIMINDSLANISPKIKELPQINHIKIGRPSGDERKDFIQAFLTEADKTIALDKGLATNDLVEATAGLTLRDIEQLLRTAHYGGTKEMPSTLGLVPLRERAREVMERSAGGHIEFLDISYGLKDVVGQTAVKEQLGRLAKLFRLGKKSALPNGILVSGPNGSGKTFVMKALAHDTDWHIVILKNIRNMWYGETERIWGIIEDIIEAIGRVIILVDEGDTELGGRGREVHEVDKRLFGKILRMMEDKKNKGRVCWIIITARPDKIEPDIKRSGRAGRHLPIFAPETAEEVKHFLNELVLKKFGFDFEKLGPEAQQELYRLVEQYYPADFDQLVEQIEEVRETLDDGEKKVSIADILKEARFVKPSDPALQRQLQIYTALLECTDERLVPERHKELFSDRKQLVEKIIGLKRILGEFS